MQGGLIHEMDTTDDDDYLLAVYWWGKPAETDVNYAYSNMIELIFKYRPLFPVNSKCAMHPQIFQLGNSGHGVQEQGSCFKRFRAEHSDLAHSCPEMERPPWAIW